MNSYSDCCSLLYHYHITVCIDHVYVHGSLKMMLADLESVIRVCACVHCKRERKKPKITVVGYWLTANE